MEWAIDRLLDHPDPFHLRYDEVRELKIAAIRQSFEHHVERCALYRRFCEGRGVGSGAINSYDDLLKIPLLSTRAFKEGLPLLSVAKEAVVKVHHSSGTSGVKSFVPRDEVTLDRFRRSLQSAIIHVQGESGYIAMLGPSPEELGDLAIANFAAIGCALAKDHEYFLKDYDFEPEEIIAAVNQTPHRPVQIGGAPMLVLDLCDYILETGERITTLSEESRITSGGGFKSLSGDVISRAEYDEQVMAAFGVERRNIRDAYSMAELNGMISECSENLKHVPPWFHLSLRRPEDPTVEVAPGEEGMPGLLDPCAHSYPGFLLADDILRVVVAEDEVCKCGRIGPCLDFSVRRAEGAESKGCGRHIEQLRSAAK